MKLFNKIAIFALAGLAFTACTEENEWVPGNSDETTSTEPGDSIQNVSFEQASATLEKDPTEATTTTVRLLREHAETTDTVPVEILTNTDSVFTLGDLVFQAGDTIATLQVDFPTAEVGTTYTLELAVTDPRYVSTYASNNTFTLKVTRVKWVALEGNANIVDKWLVGVFSGLGKQSVNPNAVIETRQDNPTMFRIHHAYHNMIAEYQGEQYTFTQLGLIEDGDPNASEYLSFRILQNGEEFRGEDITTEDLVYFSPFNTGVYLSNYEDYINYYHPSSFTAFPEQSDWAKSKVLAWQENGMPGKVQLAPYAYVPAAGGGWNQSQSDDVVTIYFPGYKDPVVAKMAEDFEWEEVFTGDFASNKMGTNGSATLYKGTCTLKTDQADSVFAADFGTAYAIDGAYGEDYPLYFAVDGEGNIQTPEDVASQSTGLVAMGDTVYATINGNKSTFSDKKIVLNITFTDKTGEIVYGTTDEVLSNITYTTVGTADWSYIMFGNEDGSPYLDAGLELQQRDDQPNTYQILHALNDVTIQFTIGEDNIVSLPQQETGAEYQPGVPIYVTDMYSLVPDGEYDPFLFDPETSTISGHLFYNIGGGQGFTPVVETIQLHFNEQPTAKAAKARKAHARKVATFAKGITSPWAKYTKANKKAHFQPMVLR